MTFKSSDRFVRNDILLDIATFLARRWSDNSKVMVIISNNKTPSTDLEKNKIILPNLSYYNGEYFQKYRQWRVALWYESMRIKYTTKRKISRYDYAHGFILKCLETKRIEILGSSIWKGMIEEIIFTEGMALGL